MVAIKGHFDGKVIVPDEPHDLRPGQQVIVQVQSSSDQDRTQAPAPKAGSAAGQIWMAPDFDEIPEDFKDYT